MITHAEPEVVNGALAVAYAVLLLAQGATPPEVLVDEVVRFIDEDAVAARLRCVALRIHPTSDPIAAATQLGTLGTSAAVDEVVASAFAAFVAAPDDFLRAVAIAVNAGGASDTRGAITGALAGTHLGVHALPSALVEALDGQPYLVMAARGLFQAAQQRAGRFVRLLVR